MSDIFGMLSKSLKPLMDLTGQKPDESTLPLILKGEVEELLSKKKEALALIGEAAYSMVKINSFDVAALRPLCADADVVDAQLKAKQGELKNAELAADAAKKKTEEAEAARTCPACGELNPEGVNFCQQCGSKLGLPKAAKCPSCGAENPPGTHFCGDCGAKLPAAAEANPKCGGCGAQNPPGTRFCGECGGKL